MSSFVAKNWTKRPGKRNQIGMKRKAQRSQKISPPIATAVRTRIEHGGERLWRMEDFSDLPFSAVARELSRLAIAGTIQRLSKGTYYRAKPTAFGVSLPNQVAVQKLAARKKALFPAGTAAANFLGFTTQTARRSEFATSATSLPRKLVGTDTRVHTRRPDAWTGLTEAEAALLDFLRRGGRGSELSPDETVRRTINLLKADDTYNHLLHIAASEPPRVRAILGALGEKMHADRKEIDRLRGSLNPLSQFEFGIFIALPNAKQWQAKNSDRA